MQELTELPLEFAFPDVGEGITEGQVLKWLKKEGEAIKADEPIVEVETGKAVVEIPAPKSGKLLMQNFKEGETVKVGQILFTMETEETTEEKAVAKKEKVEETKKLEKKPEMQEQKRESFGVVGELEEAPPAQAFEQKEHRPKTQKEELHERVHALPATRKLAKDLLVDISKIKGSGPNERVTSSDVLDAAHKTHSEEEKAAVPNAPKISMDKFGRVIEIPLTKVRSEIAKAMVKSMFSAPHAVAMEEADVTELWELRENEKKAAEEKGVHLTYLPFIVKAVIAALKDHAYLNARFDEENQKIVVKQYYNIGVAVDTANGLMVPVVKKADKRSILDIGHQIEVLSSACRERTIALNDLQGGTFTVTNYGSIAGLFGVPIINYGESAILGVGRIIEKPVAKNGQIIVAKVLPLSLSFDHRVVDGAQAAEFLKDLKKFLENPNLLILDMGENPYF
ncbi:MAG: 2-oxo acid dehydrogenase subunit E2 [Candidatus Diapherotrites archaeon]|nr:2-oxo acid dehydrogenase subunit E2 [Candidatus Diapherotrites archaeon]